MSKNEKLFDVLVELDIPVTSITLGELAPQLGYSKEQASTALRDLYVSGNATRVLADSTMKSIKVRDSSQFAYSPKRKVYRTDASIVPKRYKNTSRKSYTPRGEAMVNRLLKHSERLQKDMNTLLDDVAAMAEDYIKMSELVERIKQA